MPAEARVEGDSVVVSRAQVSAPAAVRHAWGNDPVGCNLYNQAGLPAAPFRHATGGDDPGIVADAEPK